jgi:catechol 2,3-dioxygenase-like lactoylglutathione lyase family enzyme
MNAARKLKEAVDPGAGVVALRPFVPAKDFQTSRQFYQALGFREEALGDDLVELYLGAYSFLLQNYYVEDWAGNFMMHVLLEDLDAWWIRTEALDLPGKFGVAAPTPPKAMPWGLTVSHVVDPSGVLWHFAQVLKGPADG